MMDGPGHIPLAPARSGQEGDDQEAARLATLRDYAILDTPPEVAFADVVDIAAEVCGTAMALVSFVDQDRQWFAAETGLGVRETPVGQSVCAHAMHADGIFTVDDLSQDARFRDNVLVTGAPQLRFYAGAPLQTEDGVPLGTICVLDQQSRPGGLNAKQQKALAALGRQVMAQLELRRLGRRQRELLASKDALQAETARHLAARDAALAERDLLMQEVNHRVKNSLSMVQALLHLQARSAKDEDTAQLLRNSAARVRTFGAMHEQLYQLGAETHVDMAVYLDSLLDNQRATQFDGGRDRAILLHAEHDQWPAADAANLGLILVELVTNSLKYGAGTIDVSLARIGSDVLELTVEDQGTELPESFDPEASRGFGMRLVTGLLRSQQRGWLKVDRSRGHTRFVVTFRAGA